jgi:hypothetical protein
MALLVGLGLVAPRAGRAEGEKPAPRPPVKLGKIPELRLAPRPALSGAQAKHIKDLIADLARLEKPDFGLSSTLSGDAFAPLPGQSRASTMLLTNHGLQPSGTLKELVALGPDALPFLLDALDDRTPTRIVIKHGGFLGMMSHAAEMRMNPANPTEATAYRARAGKPPREESEHVDSYTVKVGDVCFVAIGQIVGRGYQAVRYQPTACVVLNCPSHDPKLCALVRGIWKSKDARAKLFASLLADFCTEAAAGGDSSEAYAGSDYRCGAALRLLYYFPKEAAPLVAERLARLDVRKDADLDGYHSRCVANQVRSEDFINAVAWSKDQGVRAALVEVFRRAGSAEDLLAALPAVEDTALIRRRVEPMIDALPADEQGPYGDGYHLLLALAQRTPSTARVVFERYLRDASAQRCHTVCLVLRESKPEWDKALLGPLLMDRRTWGWTYAVKRGENEPRRPIRVCDEAALTLSLNHPVLKFTQVGEHADLDRQIAVIRAQLVEKR